MSDQSFDSECKRVLKADLLPIDELIDLTCAYAEQQSLLLLTSRAVGEELAIYNPATQQWTLERVPQWSAHQVFVHGRLLCGATTSRGARRGTSIRLPATLRVAAEQWVPVETPSVPVELNRRAYDFGRSEWVGWHIDNDSVWHGDVHSVPVPLTPIRYRELPPVKLVFPHRVEAGPSHCFALSLGSVHIVGVSQQQCLWKLDPQADSSTCPLYTPWTRSQPMHVKRTQAAACKWGDHRMAVVGGERLRSWEVYHARTDTWTLMTSHLLQPRSRHQLVTLEGRLVVCDGLTADWSSAAETEMYNPDTDSWQALAPIPRSQVTCIGGAAINPGTATVCYRSD